MQVLGFERGPWQGKETAEWLTDRLRVFELHSTNISAKQITAAGSPANYTCGTNELLLSETQS